MNESDELEKLQEVSNATKKDPPMEVKRSIRAIRTIVQASIMPMQSPVR
jgi:hypothetical protein